MKKGGKSQRELTIDFEMNYCQHYTRGEGADMVCAAGCDIAQIKRVQTKPSDTMFWGPCIEGHLLDDPRKYCLHWIRRTREQAEKVADAHEKSMAIFTKALPVISAWKNKPPKGKAEIITCPVCSAKLHLSQASYNGHVHARCETEGCVSFLE